MGRTKTGQRLSREDWLESALTVLSRKGQAGLRIQGLSAALGVSRGSFYWHFKNRNDFIHSLLEYWYEEYTAGTPSAVARDGGTPEERLARLMRLVHDQDLTRHDLTMRSLATLDGFLYMRWIERWLTVLEQQQETLVMLRQLRLLLDYGMLVAVALALRPSMNSQIRSTA